MIIIFHDCKQALYEISQACNSYVRFCWPLITGQICLRLKGQVTLRWFSVHNQRNVTLYTCKLLNFNVTFVMIIVR